MNFLPCRVIQNGDGLTLKVDDKTTLPVPPAPAKLLLVGEME